MKCGRTGRAQIGSAPDVELVCTRAAGHLGSHHDPAEEVYWSANSQGRLVAMPTGDGHLSTSQVKR